jgi:hypothetical protein
MSGKLKGKARIAQVRSSHFGLNYVWFHYQIGSGQCSVEFLQLAEMSS